MAKFGRGGRRKRSRRNACQRRALEWLRRGLGQAMLEALARSKRERIPFVAYAAPSSAASVWANKSADEIVAEMLAIVDKMPPACPACKGVGVRRVTFVFGRALEHMQVKLQRCPACGGTGRAQPGARANLITVKGTIDL